MLYLRGSRAGQRTVRSALLDEVEARQGCGGRVIEPGQTCTECQRRVPFPRKEASPESKVVSYRVPLDEFDAHHEVLEAAKQHLGVAGQPHENFKTVTLSLALVLQDETVKGYGQRAWA